MRFQIEVGDLMKRDGRKIFSRLYGVFHGLKNQGKTFESRRNRKPESAS